MPTSKVLFSFFEDNFKDQFVPFLLYKDNQLLKKGKHVEFAKEQLKKTKKIFWSIAFGIFYALIYGGYQLIEFGKTDEMFSLVVGISILILGAAGIYRATKEYYIIQSLMTLFLKLTEEEEKEGALA